jgi:hypothetical protein
MPLPPLLELYVLWHPRDVLGAQAAVALHEHFHGPTYAGLAGGAVEVYVRSDGWAGPEGPPRPLPIHAPLPHGLPTAEFTVILPILGIGLLRAAQSSAEWSSYLATIAAAKDDPGTLVLPLALRGTNLAGSRLQQLFGAVQMLPVHDDPAALCREVAQATAQRLADDDRPITVFVSHTKHQSLLEQDDDGPRMFEDVRRVIADTHLQEFFDAHDLQAGDDWAEKLDVAAGRHALLMVRTDLYAQREWTQREVLTAKRHDVPAVVLYALRMGEDRGSFLMDHVPTFPGNLARPRAGILRALDRLVDEVLKRTLWRRQRVYLKEHGFDWLPAHAPEPVTLAAFLRVHRVDEPNDPHLWVIHPDPPLGPNEHEVLLDLFSLAGYDGEIEVLTPRTFAARGGRKRT